MEGVAEWGGEGEWQCGGRFLRSWCYQPTNLKNAYSDRGLGR